MSGARGGLDNNGALSGNGCQRLYSNKTALAEKPGPVPKLRSDLPATIRQAADVCQARASRPATWRLSPLKAGHGRPPKYALPI